MKAKLKSASAVTRFFLSHGEKLGMAAVLAVAALLVWKSLGRERLEANIVPTQLAEKADAVTGHYQSMSWEKSFPPAERVDAGAFAATAGDGLMQPVDEEAFPIARGWNAPVVDPVGLRTDPTLLAPEEVEVRSGSGLWAFSDPQTIKRQAWAALQKQQERQKEEEEAAREQEEAMERGRGRGEAMMREGRMNFSGSAMGGLEMTENEVPVVRPASAAGTQGFEDVRGVSWVTVLAKVPIKQQVNAYEESLASSRGYDPSSDMPNYIGYQVQRAEVTEDGAGEWVTLPNVLKKTIISAMESRPFELAELANEKYVHPLLTWPLPAMVLRPWGEEVTHSDLPIPTPEDLLREVQGEQMPGQPAEAPAEEGGDDFANQMKREQGPAGQGAPMGMEGGMAMGRGMPMGMGMGRGMGMEGGMAMGRGMPMGMGMGMGRGMGMEGGMGMMGMGIAMGQGAGGYNNLPDKAWDGKTKFYLFRYFDSTVEPGRRYRYRVRLALADVNKDPIPEKYLDPTVVARKKETKNAPYRVTEWSEPSPIAAVPQAGLIYVAKASAARGANEPEARLIVKSLDAVAKAEVAVAEDFTRGSVVNLLARKAAMIWSTSFQTTDEDGEPVPAPEFDLLTGMTVLDFSGGEELNKSRDLLAPSRALVMDGTGRMSIEREIDELKAIREFDLVEQMSREAIRNRDDGGGGPEGGRRGGRGGRGRPR